MRDRASQVTQKIYFHVLVCGRTTHNNIWGQIAMTICDGAVICGHLHVFFGNFPQCNCNTDVRILIGIPSNH